MKRILTIITLLAAAMAFTSSCCNDSGQTTSERSAIEVIMSRKSVRSFTEEPVTKEEMTTMLKAAAAAPSGMNIQPWRFIVLEDKSQYETIFKDNFNLRIFNSAAAVVIFCAETTTMRSPGNGEPAVKMENGLWRDDLGACTENFLLAAEALGLGTVWTACYPYEIRMKPIRETLGIPEDVVPYSVVAVGHPDGDPQPKDKWVEDRVHYGRW